MLGLTFFGHLGQVYQTSSPLHVPLGLWLLLFAPLLLARGRGHLVSLLLFVAFAGFGWSYGLSFLSLAERSPSGDPTLMAARVSLALAMPVLVVGLAAVGAAPVGEKALLVGIGAEADPGGFHAGGGEAPPPADDLLGVPREVLELLMMAHCNDVVAANSSFSWWGAYLNQQPLRRCVAPSKWFKKETFPQAQRLYPQGWLLI